MFCVACCRLLALLLVCGSAPGLAAGRAQRSGGFSVPYECRVTPLSLALVMDPGGRSASAEAPSELFQNSTTRFRLGAVSVISPGGVNDPRFTATLEVFNQGGAPGNKGSSFLKNQSKNNAAQRIKTSGLKRSQGVARIELTTTLPTFLPGSYQISSMLSCEQDVD